MISTTERKSTKSTEFQIDVKQNYIYVTLSGILFSNTDREYIDHVLSACIEHEQNKILYDVRSLKGHLSTWDRFNIAVYFTRKSRQHPKTRNVQIAVVGFPPIIDPNRFGETVAINRGLNVNVTDDIEKALNWLKVDNV